MLAKRIIPCLDVKDGMTVKGVNFVNLRSAGDPVELGRRYSEEGADELVYLDITASVEGRKTFIGLVRRVAETVSIPFTVGGGIGSVADVDTLLGNGADKVSVNSAAIRRPELIDEIAGWLVARKLQTSGMTTHLDVKFKKSIPTGSDITLEIRARLTEIKHNFAFIAAQISCNGQVCTQGELTYFCFSKEKAQSEFHFTHCPTIDEIE